MSLVRLLKAGKSLTDLKNSTSQYRLRSRFLLPKFGSTRNPFTAPVPASVIQAASEGTAVVARYQKTPAELSAARLKRTAKLPEPATTVTPSAIGEKSGPGWFDAVSRWLPKLNPRGLWRKRDATVKPPPVARPGRSPIQAELSLDKIKVIRNDLNDADVEIVPAESSAPVKAQPVRPAIRRAAALVGTQPG